MTSFTAQIADFVTKTDERLLSVVRLSLQDMVTDMQTSTNKGGRMRVDTGFLRSTGQAALNVMPTGPSQQTEAMRAVQGQYTGAFDTFDGKEVEVVLIDLKLGDTFFFGWTAAYAPTREVYDGFMDTAVQNWQNYINVNSERFRDK